jgi:RNA ligase (TIGR02306 family)
VSEKLDGSSMTVYVYEGNFGVCSRNLDLTETEDNSFWKMARKLNLEEKMKNYGKNIAIQGELVGNGVNGNALKMTDHDLYVFKIWSIDERRYLGTEERMEILEVMELKSVPVVEKEMSLSRFKTVEELLEYAVGKSMVNPNVEREGIVFKKSDGSMSFKAISNKYLLKQE